MMNKHIRLIMKTRVANFEGHLRGTIVQESRWWNAFKRGLEDIGFQVAEGEHMNDEKIIPDCDVCEDTGQVCENCDLPASKCTCEDGPKLVACPLASCDALEIDDDKEG